MKRLEILLVEDSPSDVRLIREALKETPVNVQISLARDGIEALDFLQKMSVGGGYPSGFDIAGSQLAQEEWQRGPGGN